jgi:hypothetical protein
MGYREAVQEAKRLVKRSEEDQWRLAQLTWEQVRAGKTRRAWAQDVGIDHSHANRLYLVWERWGEVQHPNRPRFTDAYAQLTHRLEPDSEVTRAQDQAQRTVRNLPPERKAEVARELLAEPTVAEQVVRDPDARRTVRQATDRYDTEHQERAKQNYELREPRSVQIGAMADMQYALTKARTAMSDALEAADTLAAYNWPDESRQAAEVLVRRVSASVELFLARLHGEDLDEELKALVEGGDQ